MTPNNPNINIQKLNKNYSAIYIESLTPVNLRVFKLPVDLSFDN